MGFLTVIAALAIATSSNSGNPALDAFRASVPLPNIHVSPPPGSTSGPAFPLAKVRAGHHVTLRSSPGGPEVAKVGHLTEFGSQRFYWVRKVRGAWLGISAPEMPDGRLAWIRDDRFALDMSATLFWITADTSEQELELHHGDRILDRFPVTVGSATSPTPLGDYAVTDGLVGKGLGPWYGCCALALTGHQPNLPSGWIGGNRIAIHGTPGAIGGADSHGCLRASDPDMISLFARVPLGTPVFIRA
jgi:hypothetical protein